MPGFKTNHGACNRIQLAFRVRFLTKQTLVCVSVCKNLSDTKKKQSNKNKIEMILNQYDPPAHELMEVSQRQQYVMAMLCPIFPHYKQPLTV